MKTTINQRINNVIIENGYNVSTFSKKINVAYSSLNDIVKKGAEPKFSTLEKIIIAEPQINIEWLFTGEGDMNKIEENSLALVTEPKTYYKSCEADLRKTIAILNRENERLNDLLEMAKRGEMVFTSKQPSKKSG